MQIIFSRYGKITQVALQVVLLLPRHHFVAQQLRGALQSVSSAEAAHLKVWPVR